jgi:ParB family chromosome partitioning protein
LRKLISDPQLIPGIIDDIEVSKIRESSFPLRPSSVEVDELASSIKQKGLLQPIIVRPKKEQFEIVAGNRRYIAFKALGWKKITCHVVELGDKDAYEVSLVENVQRKTLSPLEEAEAFKAYVSDFGWGGVSDLAIRLGRSASYVTKRIKLLNLPSDVLDSISESGITASLAEELSFIKDKAKQSKLAEMISKRHLSIREIRELSKAEEEEDLECSKDYSFQQTQGMDHIQKVQRAMDKTIILLKMTMNRLGPIIENTEDDWVIHEILMQHNSMLHRQIDLLIKHKRKYSYKVPVLVYE